MDIVRATDRKDLHRIKHLIENYAYNDFRGYRAISDKCRAEYLSMRISDIIGASKSFVLIARKGSKPIGFICLRYLDWDSKLLGKNMFKIEYVVSDGNYSKSIRTKAGLIRAVFMHAAGLKNLHISCKVDPADHSSIHALEYAGFKLMDTVVTRIFKPSIVTPQLKCIYKVRDLKKNDINKLAHLASRRFLMNRFHIDPSIKHERADKLYAEWIKNYCADHVTGEAKVYVAVGRQGPVGFLGYRLDMAAAKICGYKIIGQGLMAVRPSSPGASIGLIKAVMRDVRSGYDIAEFDSLVTNDEAVRIYEALNFKTIRSKHTFHYSEKLKHE